MPRVRPHVKVHLTVKHHRRTAEVWADPELRGMLVGLWMAGIEQYAAKNDDQVSLNRHELAEITGRSQFKPGVNALRTLCERLELSLSVRGERCTVQLRNFAKKQGYDLKKGTPQKQKQKQKQKKTLSEDLRDPLREGAAPPNGAATRPRRAPRTEISEALVTRLQALTPPDVSAGPDEIAAWYEAMKPQWKDRGFVDYHAAARKWWPRVRQWEIDRTKGQEVLVFADGTRRVRGDFSDDDWAQMKLGARREREGY